MRLLSLTSSISKSGAWPAYFSTPALIHGSLGRYPDSLVCPNTTLNPWRGALRATPSARGVLFDQPHVVAGAAAIFAAAGVAPGDFFAAVSGGGDAYILSMILHDWDDERSLAILARCREAMAVSGTLLLVERALPVDGVDRPWEPFFSDLHMLASLGGRERSEAERGGARRTGAPSWRPQTSP